MSSTARPDPMVEAPGAERFVPPGAGLSELRAAAAGCRGCRLYRDATQTVFSRGPADAPIVLVGEQPGDAEDRAGRPFVGPAGQLLRRAMVDAELPVEEAYLTNVVKHFTFHLDARGKRRIHDKPGRIEIVACRPWLAAEFAVLRPRVVVALGATAAQALIGPAFRVPRSRGELLAWPQSSQRDDYPEQDPPARLMATVHPSAVLRAEDRDGAYEEFVADLVVAAAALRG